MSLELAIEQNTAAIKKLISVLEGSPLQLTAGEATAALHGHANDAKADKPAKTEKPAKAADPVKEEKPAEPVAAAVEAPAEAAAPADAVDFDTLKKKFLALASTNRDKAVAILSAIGVAKLTEAKPEQYAAIAAELEKASA